MSWKLYLYAVLADNLSAAEQIASKILGVHFSLHDSIVYGGDYYRYRREGLTIRIQDNIDIDTLPDEPEELAEPDFPGFALLLYIEAEGSPEELLERLNAAPLHFKLLRQET